MDLNRTIQYVFIIFLADSQDLYNNFFTVIYFINYICTNNWLCVSLVCGFKNKCYNVIISSAIEPHRDVYSIKNDTELCTNNIHIHDYNK